MDLIKSDHFIFAIKYVFKSNFTFICFSFPADWYWFTLMHARLHPKINKSNNDKTRHLIKLS